MKYQAQINRLTTEAQQLYVKAQANNEQAKLKFEEADEAQRKGIYYRDLAQIQLNERDQWLAAIEVLKATP